VFENYLNDAEQLFACIPNRKWRKRKM